MCFPRTSHFKRHKTSISVFRVKYNRSLALSLSLSLPSLSVFLPSFLSLSLPESFMGNAGISTKKPKSLKQTTEIRYEEIETIGFYWKPGPGAAKRAPMKQRRSTVKL